MQEKETPAGTVCAHCGGERLVRCVGVKILYWRCATCGSIIDPECLPGALGAGANLAPAPDVLARAARALRPHATGSSSL